MTNSITDLGESDCYLITGTNTTENHPVIATFIKRAVTQRGAKLILADPRNIELGKFAAIWLRQKPGTDVAWINGMMNVIISEACSTRVVAERTEDFRGAQATVSKYTPEYVESLASHRRPEKAARLYAKSGASAIVYAMGIQHINGTDNVKSLANLVLYRPDRKAGNRGEPASRTEQRSGACDMGCLPGNLPAYGVTEAADENLRMRGVCPFRIRPVSRSRDHRRRSGAVKALYVMGENPDVRSM